MGLKDDIISRIDISSYYSEYVQWQEQKGKNWKASCPFHSEKKASFFVEIDTGRWICMGSCSEGGDVIAFHMKYHNIDFNTAIRQLGEKAGIELPSKKKNQDQDSGQGPGQGQNQDSQGIDQTSSQASNQASQSRTRKRKGKYPKLEEEVIDKLHANLPEEEKEYLQSRGVSPEVISKLKIGFWDSFYGPTIVLPVRRNEKLYNLRFYKRATERQEKDIRQIPAKELGHNPIWVFPEPDKEKEEIYLLEGEIDALCAISIGLNACTVTGGAGTFLEEMLPYFKDKKVFICYDIDDKGRIGAKTVAKIISKVAKETRIIKLDLDKEKYENGDFNDYVIKEKKTLEDFMKLAKMASYEIYTGKDLTVIEDGGAYYKIKILKNGKTELEKISNFTIKLICRYVKEDEILREVIIISENGKTSDPSMMSPAHMSDTKSFRTFCFGRGDFIFEGELKDLMDVWHMVCSQDPDSRIVRQVFQVGFLHNYGIWIFENMAIKGKEVIRPDDRGIYWNGKYGYTFTPIDASGDDVIKHFPNLISSDVEHWGTMKNLCDSMVENIGSLDVLFGLSLTCGSIYFRDIISNPMLSCFPILFVYGTLRSGKTEYLSFLMNMFGMDKSDIESLPSITSTVPISRRLAYFSCLPCWWDEFRNDNQRTNQIMGTLRSAYDGVGRSIGVKGTQGILSESVKGTVIISGEHLPTDEALRSRIIPVRMKQSGKKIEFHKKVISLSSTASSHIFNLIKNKSHETIKELFEKIDWYSSEMRKSRKDLDERTIKNYSITGGFYSTLINPKDSVLPDYIINGGCADSFDQACIDVDEPYFTQQLQDFVETVDKLIESKGELSKISWYHLIREEDIVYIWMSPLQSAFEKEYRMSRGNIAPDTRTIMNHFRELSCLVDSSKQHKIPDVNSQTASTNHKCMSLRISKMPVQIMNWFNRELQDLIDLA